MKTPQEQFNRYRESYSGLDLLKKHSLSDTGVWQVQTESDEVGHSATIGYFNGILSNIIAYSVIQPGFWGYGSGGTITKLTIKDITFESVNNDISLRNKIKQLHADLAELTAQLPENKR